MAVVEKIVTAIILIGFSALFIWMIAPFIKEDMKMLVGFFIIMAVSLAITFITKPILSPICEFVGIPFDIIVVLVCLIVSVIVWKPIKDWIEK